MPFISGFTDNAFTTRADLVLAAQTLLKPLHAYKSSQNALIKLPTATGAGFSERAAQLEGFARPLWVVADLLRLESDAHKADPNLETWIQGLKAGTDPDGPEYWGDLGDFDQRMVEMESIAYALLTAPEVFGFRDDDEARGNLVAWLRQINDHSMPQTNWLWFRVLVNLALYTVLDVPLDEVKGHIDKSLETLDTFYLGEGWSSDGLWSDERKQADYYSGSFAIQFAQLLFLHFAPDYDASRTVKYKQQAREFAGSYWRYFSPTGAAIPFGRSLTYRFAFAAFWSAVAVVGVELPEPVSEPAAVKGLIMRHLRWWAKNEAIFNTDGTINIGYAYPNMYLSEDYNSPQSVYWCLKALIILGLPESHGFWQCAELPYPDLHGVKPTQLVWPSRHILCNTKEHHFLLSGEQSTTKRFKAREAKYTKFAYSSAFAFSVPCGPSLAQMAPDSTLIVRCLTDEDDAWRIRYHPEDVRSLSMSLAGETVSTLQSRWRPWKKRGVSIHTTLIPPLERWPGWHIRVHQIEITGEELEVLDVGFAISAQTSQDASIFEMSRSSMTTDHVESGSGEGWWSDEQSALVISQAGACGIVDLTSNVSEAGESDIIRADPNTNLMSQRSLIPAVKHIIKPSPENETVCVMTAVFAIEASAAYSKADIWRLWCDRPGRVEVKECLKHFPRLLTQ